MIRIDVSDRDRRALAAGALMFAFITASPFVSRLRSWQAAQLAALQLAMQSNDLASMSESMLRVLHDSAVARSGRLAMIDDVLIAGSTVDAVAANLGTEVSRLADSSGVRITNLQLRTDRKPSEGHVGIAVRVTGTMDAPALAALLGALDESRRHLVVRDIAIARGDGVVMNGRAPALRCELLVETIGVLRPRTTQ